MISLEVVAFLLVLFIPGRRLLVAPVGSSNLGLADLSDLG